MSDFVRFSAVRDSSEGVFELEVAFSSSGFSGYGAAYFESSSVQAKLVRLTEFPLPIGNVISIEGGFLDPERPEFFREVHVSLKFWAETHQGVRMQVEVAMPRNDRQGVKRSAMAIFSMDYEQLNKVVRGIRNVLVDGDGPTVIYLVDIG